MSLMLARIDRERVLLGTDTACQFPNGNPGVTMKMQPLPHLGGIVVTIGNTDACIAFSHNLTMMGGGLDGVFANAPSAFNQALSFYSQNMRGQVMDQQGWLLAGWSPSANQMRAFYGERMKRGQEMQVREVRGNVISPPWPDYQADMNLGEVEVMRAAAQAQVDHVRAAVPKCPIGGSLVMAEVTSGAINLISRRLT